MHKIAFRTDASSKIGTGHFMRCLTLAVEMKRNNAQVCFICRNLPDYLSEMLTLNGIELKPLISTQDEIELDELAHASWLGVSQTNDAIESIQLLSRAKWDWIIIDHYSLDFRWESKVRQSVKKILVIDDIADRQHDCDILLDQNFYSDMDMRYLDKVPEHCKLLLGPSYVLIRDEFRLLHEKIRVRKGPVKHILVFFGGVDTDNCTGRTIDALSMINTSNLHVDVVIGAQHPCREIIIVSCAQHGFICHVQTEKMAELMATADLAIGAGGSAIWERCSMGLPSIILILGENQSKAAKDLETAGVLVNLGDAKQVAVEELAERIKELIGNEKLRSELSKQSLKLVSLSNKNKVAEIMVGDDA